MRGRFFWRIGALFAMFFLFSVGACAFFIYLIISALGMIQTPGSNADVLRAFGIAAIIFLVMSLGFSGRALRRATKPLGDLIDATGRVADGDYSPRVAERGPREVRALIRAFNAMIARLQASDTQRRDLLAEMTHELRTPLTVIQGNLEGLVDGVYPADREHLERILEETRVLARLIDDLRTLALAERGALILQKTEMELGVLLNETLASFQPQANAAGVELIGNFSAELQAQIDPARIRQVLENLIANALRYTPRGGKIIVESVATENHVRVSVTDNGAGIAAEDLPRVFDRFYKSRDSRGSGLGLAIAKKLVEAHNGEISVESRVGEGTTIRFNLPLAAQTEKI